MKLCTLLTAALFAMALAACEKDDEQDPKNTDSPEAVRQEITKDLAEQANISVFVEAFEALELKEEDIDQGITIFAPTNEALKGADANARVLESDEGSFDLSDQALKDHIVKGVLQAAGLQDGDTLITLNGKELLVTIDGDQIWINGVLLTKKNVASKAKYAVHTVAQILSNTSPVETTDPSIEITVWNGARWTPESPKGETQVGVTVSLYNSQQDYAQGNQAAYVLQTQAEGKVTFEDIEPGKTYYLVAEKDDMSNLFYVTQSQEGGLIGMVPAGIFQSQAEIESNPDQPDAQPGNFRWTDQNGDGAISEGDFVALPYQTASVEENQTLEVEITIGFSDNYNLGYIKTEAAALDFLKRSYQRLDGFQKELILIDGTLSDDAACEGGQLCDLDGFQVSSANQAFSTAWNEGYGTISQLNRLMRDLPGITFSGKQQVLAQAKGIRAYIYLQLTTYFGDIPLQTGMALEQGVEQTSRQQVYELIVTDLSEALDQLPATPPTGESYQLSQGAVRALLAKTNLLKGDYQGVVDFTGNILNNQTYQLMASTQEAFTPGNAEIIWDFSFGAASSRLTYFYNGYFSKGSFCPSMRLTEVYLMDAEAKFSLGLNEQGVNSLNMIRTVLGFEHVTTNLSTGELIDILRATWKEAMSLEGSRYANLVRWGEAQEVLAAHGYQSHHGLLPIPQVFTDSYHNLVQNPGY